MTYKRLLEWEIGIMEDKEKLKRWRLILGQDSEERFAGMGAEGLDEEQQIMDMALAAIYLSLIHISEPTRH